MPVIAGANRKGGSGKSTLAAHMAAWCARQGNSVMLGDVDRQQSARAWLKRRDPNLPVIAPWAVDQKNMLRVPASITHVVLDTPGGMHGFELARVVMFADAIIMPVCNSMFDRESAAACHAELMALPRVASGRCRLVTVGMRIDGRTNAAQTLRDWSDGLAVPFLGTLRETQLYVRSLERGMTIFDLPPNLTTVDLQQWEPILQWLRPVLYPPHAPNDSAATKANTHLPTDYSMSGGIANAVSATPTNMNRTEPAYNRLGSSLPSSLMPTQESLVHGGRLSMHGPGRLTGAPVMATTRPELTNNLARNVNSQDGLELPQFLKQVPR
jgi:chromosome partitioning protein